MLVLGIAVNVSAQLTEIHPIRIISRDFQTITFISIIWWVIVLILLFIPNKDYRNIFKCLIPAFLLIMFFIFLKDARTPEFWSYAIFIFMMIGVIPFIFTFRKKGLEKDTLEKRKKKDIFNKKNKVDDSYPNSYPMPDGLHDDYL